MKKNIPSTHFKVKDLKFFSNPNSIIFNSRKYRSVFEQSQVGFLYAEFSFYNLKFNEEDWNTNITSTCYLIDGNGKKSQKKFEKLNAQYTISKTENIFKITDSWGDPMSGNYWKAGKYSWEIKINNQIVIEKNFVINNFGLTTNNLNPYFFFENLQFYKAAEENETHDNLSYFYQLNPKEIKYLGIELKVLVKIDFAFDYEFFIVITNQKGIPTAFFNYVGTIPAGNQFKSFTIRNTWGSTTKGTAFKNGTYTVNVLLMEHLFASKKIVFGKTEVPENLRHLFEKNTSSTNTTSEASSPPINTNPDNSLLDENLQKLNRLIGLTKVKNTITDLINYKNYNKARITHGFKDDSVASLHAVFSGNPGTGKTTVVKLLGGIFQALGLLSKGHVVEVDRTDLVANFIGQTAPKTKQAIERARGGILFIDEAYSLARSTSDTQDFGNEVIEVLLKEISEGPGDISIMVAGYPEEMNTFLNSNPGLKSRFTNHFVFDDFLPDELLQIAKLACEDEEVTLSPEAEKALEQFLTNAYRKRDKNFGNARFVYNLIDQAKRNKASRLMSENDIFSLSKEEISLISTKDIEALLELENQKMLQLNIDYDKLNQTFAELDKLVGLDELKKEINELILLTKYYLEQGINITGKFSLHFSLSGNPGTGKTTIARILGTLFNALGILERGHVVEVDRSGLVAGFVGQTAIKTKEVIERAKGGILFIDEAYALAAKGGNDFGNEAIETILKEMEDNRNEFSVIVAGYPDEMKTFLKSNPGLLSRFNNHFTLPDFDDNELFDILNIIIGNENFIFTQEAEKHIKTVISTAVENRDKFFGNARYVRQLSDQIIKNAHLRLAKLSPEERKTINTGEIEFSDVENLRSYNPKSPRNQIGFNRN